MRSVHALLAFAAFLAAFNAHAAVTGVVTATTATTAFQNGLGTTYNGTQIIGTEGDDTLGSGATFASTSSVSQNLIEFQNGNASGGAYASVTSETWVDVTFTNTTGHTVVPKLVSQIIPAGLGFYVSDGSSPLCSLSDLTGCGVGSASTFQAFSPTADFGPAGAALAGATVDFQIMDNGQSIYEISAAVSLNYDPISGLNVINSNVATASSILNGFTLSTGSDGQTQFGYSWNATNIVVTFPDAARLKKNQSATLSYDTTVTTYTRADCLSDSDCLVAYGSFGDPIGGGGGIQPGGGDSAFVRTLFAGGPIGGGPIGGGLTFDSETFGYPTFRGDGLILTLDSVSGVPEPGTWGIMILGLAMIGVVARRRRAELKGAAPGQGLAVLGVTPV